MGTRVKAEDAAWSQVIQSYNERQTRVTAELAAQSSSTAPKSPSEWMSNLDDQWKDAARIAQAEIDGLDGGRIEESLRDMLLGVEENVRRQVCISLFQDYLTSPLCSPLSRLTISIPLCMPYQISPNVPMREYPLFSATSPRPSIIVHLLSRRQLL